MEGEDFAESLVFHMTGSHLPNGSVGAKSDQVGSNAEHIGERGEGLIGEFHEGFLEDGMGFSDKAAVAFEIIGKMLADLFFHFGLVAGVFEGLAVVPSDPVEGFARDDLDVVGSFLAGEGKEFVEKERGSEDGGACVVGEALVTENRGTTSGLFESFEQSDVVASGLESDGGSKTAKSGTDDEGGGRAGAIMEKMLRWAAEGCEVVEIENIKPGADVFPLRVRGFLVAVHALPLLDRGGGAAVHKVGPGFDLLSASTVLLIFFNPAEDFAIA